MKIKALAKINLSLDVVGRRDDGYHEMNMLMVPLLDLYDEIDIDFAEEDLFTCNAALSWDESNLVYKAVSLFRQHYNVFQCFRIHLKKHIPPQAGLGGGSSDAAAILQALYEMCGVRADRREKIAMGKSLGADVPFCLFSRCAHVTGIGEVIDFIDLPDKYKAVLIKPEIGVPTGEAFRLLDSMEYHHPDIEGIIDSFINEKTPALGNSLEDSAMQLAPVIGTIKQQCRDMGFELVLMSGSGSTVYVLVDKDRDVSELKQKMTEAGHQVFESSLGWRTLPELETARLRLRHVTMEDAQAIFDGYASNPEVTRFLSFEPHADVEVTKERVQLWLQQYHDPDCYRYVIENKEDGSLMGMVDVVGYHEGLPAIGYVLGREYWNHGYMTEACSALVRQLNRDGYDNVVIEAQRENLASNRVILKQGFKLQETYAKTMKNRSVAINSYRQYLK